VCDVAAEVAHNGEGVGEEGLHVEVLMPFDTGGRLRTVSGLAAGEAHLVQAENLFANLAVVNVFLSLLRRGGEVVVEVAAQVDLLLVGLGHHFARLAHLVREGFLHQHVLSGLHCFHGRFVVPASVFITAGAHVHDVKVGLTV
jgi:hypothetical protein